MRQEPACVYFLYQMVFAVVILKLMLYNMAKKPFAQIHFQYAFVLAPIIAYQIFGVTAGTEVIITRICMVIAFLDFYFSIARISR
jgi:hypothetical protein